MSVAILSDSPTLTTGFGRTTGHMARALAALGREVDCFGLKARPADVAGAQVPYRVWPAEQGGHWTATLAAFFDSTGPNALVLNMDAFNAVECLDACRAAGWRGPTVSYVCFDGLPVGRRYLDAQRSCAAVWATSHTGANYLRSNGVPVAGAAPPGVDRREFRPNPRREDLRARAGVGDATIVGVFATNTERKQVARVLTGFALALPRLEALNPKLYLHCRPDGHWRLDEMASSLGLRDRVLFAGAEDFDERRGVPTSQGGDAGPVATAPPGARGLPAGLSYVDRLNCCDVVVNVPHSGDVEQVILEAQACDIPLVHTDDSGVMTEALGDGALRLPAGHVGIGRTGQRLHYVATEALADALVAVLADRELRERLSSRGLANVEWYTWDVLEAAAVAMVEPFTVKAAT